ncbi:MAG: SanA/YdcF family protein [Armatimonadota bacterium]
MSADTRNRMKVRWRWVVGAITVMFLLLAILPIWAFRYVRSSTLSMVVNPGSLSGMMIAIVPGANVYSDGTPSKVLRMRLDKAIELYKDGHVQKLLVSGDNRFKHYNEPDVMKRYAVRHGVPASDVVCDYAGRRTYDTMYRARNLFMVSRSVIVTQDRFMGRSLYLAKSVHLDAVGVTADTPHGLPGMSREYLACVSAWLDVNILHPSPVMGKPEPIVIYR